jgi:hypothetical protein
MSMVHAVGDDSSSTWNAALLQNDQMDFGKGDSTSKITLSLTLDSYSPETNERGHKEAMSGKAHNVPAE